MPTTEFYLTGITNLVNKAERKWRGLAIVLAQQYAAAYDQHVGALKAIKSQIETRRKQEEESRALALSIVTAGLLGPFSKMISLPTLEKSTSEALSREMKALYAVGSNTVAEISKKVTGKLSSLVAAATDPPAMTLDGFSPQGMTPLTYWMSLEENVGQRFEELADLADAMATNYGGITPEAAKDLHDTFEQRCLGGIEQLGNVHDGGFKSLIRNQAEAALWIAWLRVRDRDYWYSQSVAAYGHAGGESLDWAPLVPIFRRLNLPVAVEQTFGRERAMAEVVNMPGAIDYARSPFAFITVTAPLSGRAGVNSAALVGRLASFSTL